MAWSFLEKWRTLSLPEEGIGGGDYRRKHFGKMNMTFPWELAGGPPDAFRGEDGGRRGFRWMDGWVRVLDFSVVFFVGVV